MQPVAEGDVLMKHTALAALLGSPYCDVAITAKRGQQIAPLVLAEFARAPSAAPVHKDLFVNTAEAVFESQRLVLKLSAQAAHLARDITTSARLLDAMHMAHYVQTVIFADGDKLIADPDTAALLPVLPHCVPQTRSAGLFTPAAKRSRAFPWSLNMPKDPLLVLVFDLSQAVSEARRTDQPAKLHKAQRLWWILARGQSYGYQPERGRDEHSQFRKPEWLWVDSSPFFPEDEKCCGLHADMSRSPARGRGRGLVQPLGASFAPEDLPNRQGQFIAINYCPDAASLSTWIFKPWPDPICVE
ncbi:hypothetical protein HDU86_004175 [Geranomyces michiganensis]|nr:hypothetical protein HDU86_004175 [Geranomyces michiganensis]